MYQGLKSELVSLTLCILYIENGKRLDVLDITHNIWVIFVMSQTNEDFNNVSNDVYKRYSRGQPWVLLLRVGNHML